MIGPLSEEARIEKRKFGTTVPDLQQLQCWLEKEGIRAAGSQDYHALKFVAQGSSATASISGERYTAIDGGTSARQPIHGPIPVWKDQPCRIRLQARGVSFTLYVDGQLVDYWLDGRLKSGGVGLFCVPGERARIVWMRVSHQTDLTPATLQM
jgi:hypothetical protein